MSKRGSLPIVGRPPGPSLRNPPSIFNDVIGPVMRGPSSSHCAASVRIGRLARDLMDGRIERVLVEFDLKGSLATTHTSQGSDMGLFGGFLGWEADDDRMVDSARAVREAGIDVEFAIRKIGAIHPNTYKLTLTSADVRHTMTAISTGGGMIDVVEIDGIEMSLGGDFYCVLVHTGSDDVVPLMAYVNERITAEQVILHEGPGTRLIEIRAQRFPDESVLDELCLRFPMTRVNRLAPVLPVLSRADLQVPYLTSEAMLASNAGKDLTLWELGVEYEMARGNLARQDVEDRMLHIVRILRNSIRQGIEGTEFADRILGPQSGGFKRAMESGGLLDGGMLNRMILYVSAMMEVKSAMGVIVAAPTAGACATLPGAVIAAAEGMGRAEEDMARAMLAAGMIGVFIAAHSSFAAEVGGCQAETGSGASMAAAALVTLAGGTARQAVGAASVALQNSLGMICDPVANRVEVPCLGKNVMGAANALSCANMLLAGYDPVIPLDEVIETHHTVGNNIPCELRCTAQGGLSVTQTSKLLEERLASGVIG
ncbi:MAG TPA: L-serine ammonia-lyase, iron-sulfur-dependent, subunit alpha [Gemmatimonadales bacterium]|nr:L-serine ammonia-lyase, iron-sulfur-dependent, subunit alpha [Gemmatimonadales bacterium]